MCYMSVALTTGLQVGPKGLAVISKADGETRGHDCASSWFQDTIDSIDLKQSIIQAVFVAHK